MAHQVISRDSQSGKPLMVYHETLPETPIGQLLLPNQTSSDSLPKAPLDPDQLFFTNQPTRQMHTTLRGVIQIFITGKPKLLFMPWLGFS